MCRSARGNYENYDRVAKRDNSRKKSTQMPAFLSFNTGQVLAKLA
jgi:hypothetical protein